MYQSRMERRAAERRAKKMKRSAQAVSISVVTGMGIAMAPTGAFAAEIALPGAPSTIDLCGITNDAVIIPSDPAVTWYQVTGEPGAEVRTELTAGQQPVLGLDADLSAEFVAVPTAAEDTFPDGSREQLFTLDYTNTPCGPVEAIITAPIVPIFQDNCGTDNDILRVEAVEGVLYQLVDVDGNVDLLPGENRTVSGDVEVVAIAEAGYEIPAEVQVSWQYSFTDNPCTITVEPAAPTFDDQSGTANDTIVIPESEGVDYTVNGDAVAAGTYPGAGDVTVNAVAEEGFAIDENATSSWNFSFDATVDDVVVAPAEPDFTDEVGTANDTFVLPDSEGIVWTVNDEVTEPGTYPGTGSVVVEATAAEGYALDPDATSTWNFTFTDGTPVVVVAPAAPDFNDEAGTADDTFVLPAGEGIIWTVNDEVFEPGTYSGTGSLVVEATAADGYALDPEVTSTWNFTFTDETPAVVVSPATPVFTDESGTADDVVVLPESEGVNWNLNGAAILPGTYPATGAVTVEAVAAPGYEFGPDEVTQWNFNFSAEVDDVVVTPAAPVFTDEAGTANDVVVIPEVAGLNYFIDDVAVAPGTYPATGAVVVTVTADEGYELAADATTRWAYLFDATENAVVTLPAELEFEDLSGTAGDTVTLPAIEGVQWILNGEDTAPGTYPVSGEVVIQAEALDGFVFPANAQTTWTLTFSSAVDEENPVVLEEVPAPEFDSDLNVITIPDAEGLEYLINDEVAAAGDHAILEDSVVTARALDGYALPAGAVTEWAFDFVAAPGNDNDDDDTVTDTDPRTDQDDTMDNVVVVDPAADDVVVVDDLGACPAVGGPFYEGEVGYSSARDGNSDGVACESGKGTTDELAYTGANSGMLGMLGIGGLLTAAGAGSLLIVRRKF